MSKQKMSFFERLTGTINADYDDDLDINAGDESSFDNSYQEPPSWSPEPESHMQVQEEEGQLSVDVYQTQTEIIVQAMVAGVRPEDLDVSITREMVTIKGKRHAPTTVRPEDYVYQELYWGSFTRSITLPQEVEVEEAEATESHGLLMIKLPKIDKERSTRLKIKTSR